MLCFPVPSSPVTITGALLWLIFSTSSWKSLMVPAKLKMLL